MLTALLLVLVVFGYAVPKDFVVTDGIPTFGTAIAGVAFDGVDIAVFDFLNDANMVGEAVLGAAVALVVPVEVDDHAGDRFDGTVHPLSFCLEPIHTDTAACGVGDDACFEVAALVSAPADKAMAPCHSALESIPAPVGFTAHIADLRQRNHDNIAVPGVDAVENGCPHGIIA